MERNLGQIHDDLKERAAFEDFTSGPDWRSLPLEIKLMVVNLWRVERDVPSIP